MKWWVILTIVVILVILSVGLKPKDFSPPNHAEWIAGRTGLHFEKYGIAYTDSISDLIQAHISPQKAFSIEVALKAKNFSEDGFHFILLIHGGVDGSQLLIGQWRSSLIIMNGDDYEYRRKSDRITVTPVSESPETQFLTVTTGKGGTGVYLNGKLAAAKKEMRLEMPDSKNTRLLIGNSVYGNYHWEGDIYGVAVFGKALSGEEVERHYNSWTKHLNFSSFAASFDPLLLYNLEGNGMNTAVRDPDTPHSLQIPPRLKILIPSFFFQKWNILRFHRNLFKDRDAVLNFFGFIPLGLLLAATLAKRGGRLGTHCVSLPLATGFLLSLLIETVQAWMPARSSDMQDLILNTAGTLAGALLCRFLLSERRQ